VSNVGFENVAADLEAVADTIRELAMDTLREGLAEGSSEAAELATRREKLLNRARAAVMRAAALVDRAGREAEDGAGPDEEDF
jgi:hypothetical protein